VQDFVIVTGAKGAIGSQITDAFVDRGVSVLALDRKVHLDTLPVSSDSSPATFDMKFDISNIANSDGAEELRALVEQFTKLDFRLVGLVNNAAVQVVKPHSDISPEEWLNVFLVNAIAPALLVKLVTGKLRENLGAVVNIGSVHDYVTKPGFSAYAASKGALTAITRGIALDEGPAFRIYNLAPGAVDTPMLRAGFNTEDGLAKLAEHQPLGRIAKAREIADLVVGLVLDGASLLSGSTLRVDGAIHARLHDPE
jgi:NAD(P)-dependent dehydrogenase (short-subunit alcohol dehydrogenase family)